MALAPLARLAALQGFWQAIYQLRGDPSFESDSPSHAVIVPMLGGRFVRIDYTWNDRGAPQQGSLLVGLEAEVVTAAWVDSWHNGSRMMICSGALTSEGGLDIRGTYPAGPGLPDWGWRTHLVVRDQSWTMTMFNVSPAGDETLAVRAEYARANT
jgi:hypothetical protein